MGFFLNIVTYLKGNGRLKDKQRKDAEEWGRSWSRKKAVEGYEYTRLLLFLTCPPAASAWPCPLPVQLIPISR